ncbi:uncharacterized protein LOC117566415 isoform X1 [Drosophila albomicans]|uniref:Uncharacterized protein LOC117566415 isoform X1 n=1 Tax=Drosophila albomicans TaxID=7291 RepID=A0A6P8WR82_DROAB|nr:uncharacterized protein LOC117566415 isoform X1 [Drosophila albomicans]
MMETLDQQQTANSTLNIESHSGHLESSSTPSEEDDFEDNNDAFGLEAKKKSEAFHHPQVILKKVAVEHHENLKDRTGESPVENGGFTQHLSIESESEPHGSKKDSANSSDDTSSHPPSSNSVKIECTSDEKKVFANQVDDKPSASPKPALHNDVSSDGNKPEVDIKMEGSSSPHTNNCNNDVDSSSLEVKIVEDYESSEDERDDSVPIFSPAMKSSEETCSQDEEKVIKVEPCDDIKMEENSTLAEMKTDDEDVSSSVIPTIEESSPELVDSQDEETSLAPIKTIDTRSDLTSSTKELDGNPSLSLKTMTEIKSEEYINSEEDKEPLGAVASPAPEPKIDEREAASSTDATMLHQPDLLPAAEETRTPVYKIDDLSPASIPDDDESIEDFNTEMKVDNGILTPARVEDQPSVEIIKIESDSDEELANEEGLIACKDDASSEQCNNLEVLPMETSIKIKINGAHTPLLVPPDTRGTQEKDCMDQQHIKEEMETEESEAVIASNAANEVEQVQEQQAEQEMEIESQTEQNNYGRSSRSSSVSSTSQQLVIDHPESEHNTKHQLKKPQIQTEMEQPQQQVENTEVGEEEHQQQDQQSFHATKRRRSDSINESCSKQQRIEAGESSLLMQRLQAPTQNSHELGKLLSCYKCNANSFDNLQQLNAHYALCGQPREATVGVEHSAPESVPQLGTIEPVPESTATQPTITKERFFRCVRCSTVHQSWNFFLHMRVVHNRYICLYCSHVFASVEKLSLHLENKHDMDQRHFNTVDAWQTLQTQQDRVRYLVCCNCQATFENGSEFDNHDCAELMQPCGLCGQKGGHINGCRNGRSATSTRKKTAVRRKRKPARSKQQTTHLDERINTKQLEEMPNWMDSETAMSQEFPQPAASHENNIPAPSEDAPMEEAMPKLVVPKIMLRVPKEFQKSVDAALSSTDTEDEENDEMPSTAADCSRSPASLLTVDAVNQRQELLQLPVSNLSEDTETATETASMFHEATHTPANISVDLDDDDSHTAKLTQALAEFERTKLDIQRARADIMAKKEQHLQMRQMGQQEEVHHQHQEQEQQQRRWSPTPPASPHNNHINNETHVPKEQEELPAMERPELLSEVNPEPELPATATPAPIQHRRDTQGSECMDIDDSLTEEQHPQHNQIYVEAMPPVAPSPPADGIQVAGVDTYTVDLQLDRPLDKFELVDFVRLCLRTVYPNCLYCNHARRIAVNAKQLVLHLIAQHRFTATVDSITAEELHAETIVARLKSYLPALEGDQYLNSASCCSLEDGRFTHPFNERIYECFQCRFVTATHKELYTHNRRLHTKMNITCAMCNLNYFSYSELLCHICPGETSSHIYNVQFRCCFCETMPLPSAFRLMVHLRKQHQTCDICLEDCNSQAKLSAHVWKHKVMHVCYRCGIAYRSKQDISKHLFWKHGTESVNCKRCLQKRWHHIYHFCVPATQFTCEQCQYSFSKAIYLEVHKRQHEGDFRYACNEEECEEKFVSRKLLLKHAAQHEVKELPTDETLAIEGAQLPLEEEKRPDAQHLEKNEHAEDIKSEPEPAKSPKAETANQIDGDASQQQAIGEKSPKAEDQEQPRKRRKKSKRNKASLEDLNLIAPNLSESDSSDDSDSDAARSVGAQPEMSSHGTLPMRVPASVDDLDMPKVMLSPSSESDNEEDKSDKKEFIKQPSAEKEVDQEKSSELPKQEINLETDNDEQKAKLEMSSESTAEEVADIWKNLLQHQPSVAKMETDAVAVETEPREDQQRPTKLHVVYSDHDYCKMQRTPPPTPAHSTKKTQSTPNKVKRGNASSDSDSSSSSSSSDSDSSSCSCGSNCSCSSSGSSSSDDDSDNESNSSVNAKKMQKKNIELPESKSTEEFVNVTSVNEEEPRPETPKPNVPLYHESDFDSAVSDTDEEFYDAHPQKTATELLAQKRQALIQEQANEQVPNERSNFDIVENSRPSTPSLPEDAAAFADRRERVSKNKKKKRERKSTCKSTMKFAFTPTTELIPPQQQHFLPQISSELLHGGYIDKPVTAIVAATGAASSAPTQYQLQNQQQMLTDPMTPLTHRPAWQPRMSGGSSCSDADGQLKRSKRTRRPNKFYGYTSDDEMMSSVLAPPLQVGMQLIKPQPPPQLTWAKEDLPTPPKQQRSRNNHSEQHSHHQHSHSNGNTTRKRNKRPPQSGGSGSARRSAKRVKTQLIAEQQEHHHQQAMPPIPTLKIRPALLPVSVAASDSSDSSSDDENAEINVTSLLPHTAPIVPTMAPIAAQPFVPAVPLPVAPPPPPPATTAFNQPIPPALLPNPDFATLQYFKANNIRYPIRPPAGARLAREGESVYCYCRCPYDEVSEMIACDGSNCLIEWFHFECVGIMVAPQGKWFCAECRPKYTEGLYPAVRGK